MYILLNVIKIQIEAGKFLEDVDCLTIENIKHWLSGKGYTLHYFSEEEAESLNVDKDEKGFKRKSELLKIVYIKDSLPYNDKLETIIHECGHVLFDDALVLKTVKYRELVANLFSEYVSNPNRILYAFYKLFKHKRIFTILVIALILGVFLLSIY